MIRNDGKQRHAVGNGVEAAWAPDGSRLAFVQSALGGPVVSVDVSGSGRKRLTSGRFDHGPAWSPDGSRIAFSRATTIGGVESVYLVGADGTGLRALGPQGSSPSWSPDGRSLAFWQRNQEGVVLVVFSFADSQVRRVTRTFAAYSRAGSLVAGRLAPALDGVRGLRRVPPRRGRGRRELGDAARPGQRPGLVAGRLQDRVRPAPPLPRLERVHRAGRRNRPAPDHSVPLVEGLAEVARRRSAMAVRRQGRREHSYLKGTGATEDAGSGGQRAPAAQPPFRQALPLSRPPKLTGGSAVRTRPRAPARPPQAPPRGGAGGERWERRALRSSRRCRALRPARVPA